MTKAEARAQLGSLIRDREALLDPEDPEDIYMADIEALQMAIGWLPEGGGAMFTEGEMAAIIRAQDELLQYRELGALEECREAMGRQRGQEAAGGADGSHGALEGLKALFENRGRGW